MTDAFDPASAGEFVLDERRFDGRHLLLEYRWTRGPRFTERIDLGREAVAPVPDELLDLCHLAAGTSYYKAAAPAPVVVDRPLTPAAHFMFGALLDEGLREFAVTNGLDVPLPVDLRADIASAAPGSGAPAGRGAVVPLGGGKDSALVARLLPDAELLSINAHPASRRTAAANGRELWEVGRRIDPALLELNRRGARNGHVPVTAIVALISAVAAVAAGRRDVVLAVERSASEATRVLDNIEVNHQFSKSLGFEDLLGAALAEIPGRPRVFSLLRGWSEVEIGRRLLELGSLDDGFLSCNTAFRMADRQDRWCGRCPKCHFTFLVLAPWSTPSDLAVAFGGDLLADPEQTEGFRALLDPEAKPFECVGEVLESRSAVAHLADDPAWSDHAVVRALAPLAVGAPPLDEIMRRGPDRVPDDYRDAAR